MKQYGLYRRMFDKWDGIDDTFYWLDKKNGCVLYHDKDKGWVMANGCPEEWICDGPSKSKWFEPSNPLTFLLLTGHAFEEPNEL